MSIDRRRREAFRATADDEDQLAALRAFGERARGEGDKVWLEPLIDRVRWSNTPEPAQDQAARVVAGRLGAGWELMGMRVWACDQRRAAQTITRSGGPEDMTDTEAGVTVIPNRHRLATFKRRSTGMEMQLVPGRGPMSGKCNRRACRKPGADWWNTSTRAYYCEQCARLINRLNGPICSPQSLPPFLIGRWPVTVEQWNIEMDLLKRTGAGDLPVTGVAHDVASAWCAARDVRLPTAGEWEHACRAGTTTRYFWGDEIDYRYCWIARNSATETIIYGGQVVGVDIASVRPHAPAEHDDGPRTGLVMRGNGHLPAGCAGWHRGNGSPGCPREPHHHHDEKCPRGTGRYNAFGLVDMLGNVWEWCSDESGLGDHAIRGGSFREQPGQIGEARWAGGALEHVGFRAVASIPGWPP